MKRKIFIERMTLGSGGVLLLPSIGLLQSCEYKPRIRTSLTDADIPLLNEIGDTIIPTTDATSGAKATNIGEYMLLMYYDCMPEEEQTIFVNGLNELDTRSSETFSSSFLEAEAANKSQLLEAMQAEAIAYNLEMEGTQKPLPHYFDILKGLTVSGYFSSEIGMTQARNYLPVPGKFEACIPYNKSDGVWAL
ncbi:gluconate 2-dehydrogenase subunit 3 family protein [Maribacter halichondriae]|uniref:gluconate 2-dehydrogenase subunit 3 family protein n=1 Tax=Maribacter halichondriae TaxID=2980554 RepID=UPI0023588894|nr:gluconate 2-dehydrogenase subunit 3 family protein [Maribacter sp. Hal144]